MKPIAQFILLTALLAACATPPADIPAASPGPSSQTATPTTTLAPKDTSTALSASLTPDTSTPDTPTPGTPTITPLPTIPTFTPTFDVQTIVTATPAPMAECPKENPELLPDFPYCDATGCSGGPYRDATLNYLNSGGTLDKLESKKWENIIDLTGDKQREIAFVNFGKLFIFGCINNHYKILGEFSSTQGNLDLHNIEDINGNGIPELLFSNYERRAFRSIRIIEWNGSEFKPLIKNEFVNSSGNLFSFDWLGGTILDYEIKDTNENGTKEIIATRKIPVDPGDLSLGLPWREEVITLKWNGENYVIAHIEYSPPNYRFQSIQDADNAVLIQSYETAFKLYQQAISSENLDWWSQDRQRYESKTTLADWFQNAFAQSLITATPYPTLPAVSPDPTEYPRLAAYAYYRMIILHTFLGEMDSAQVKYATLQEKFPADSPGHPYVEMATDFWNAYQSSGLMYDACAAAIAYADAHPEILIPLGSDYHGAQSHTYTPADVCPFR